METLTPDQSLQIVAWIVATIFVLAIASISAYFSAPGCTGERAKEKPKSPPTEEKPKSLSAKKNAKDCDVKAYNTCIYVYKRSQHAFGLYPFYKKGGKIEVGNFYRISDDVWVEATTGGDYWGDKDAIVCKNNVVEVLKYSGNRVGLRYYNIQQGCGTELQDGSTFYLDVEEFVKCVIEPQKEV